MQSKEKTTVQTLPKALFECNPDPLRTEPSRQVWHGVADRGMDVAPRRFFS